MLREALDYLWLGLVIGGGVLGVGVVLEMLINSRSAKPDASMQEGEWE